MRFLSPYQFAFSAYALAVFSVSPAAQCELDKIIASVGAPGEQFGLRVGISGRHAVLAAPFDTDMGFLAGSAYVFEQVGGEWIETAKLFSSDIAPNDRFGHDVAIDGDVIVVGVRYNDDVGYGTGSAYVFERIAGSWVETIKVLASDFASNTLFGQAVAVSGDVFVVGAHSEDHTGAGPGAGAAYVFERQGGTWAETSKLTASDAGIDDRFGYAVSVSGDVAVIGAIGSDEVGPQSGVAYVFLKIGGSWTEVAKLVPLDAEMDQQFGNSVNIDGDIIVVGAANDDHAGLGAGSAYVFEKQGGVWTEVAKLVASDAQTTDFFGNDVAISGGNIVIGAFWTDLGSLQDTGSCYVFQEVGGVWTEVSKLTSIDVADFDGFANSVDVDGDLLLCGAKWDDDWGPGSGSAYFWSISETGCPALHAAPAHIIVAAEDSQYFALDAGDVWAGHAYVLAGSQSGTTPGFHYGGFLVPLNPDPYFDLTLTDWHGNPIEGGQGLLDAEGKATAVFTMPPAMGSSLVGTSMHHVMGVFVPLGLTLVFVSEPVQLEFF